MKFSLLGLFPDIPEIDILDIGAAAIGEWPVYKPMTDNGACTVTGFEPSPEEYDKLLLFPGPQVRFFPFALGDGEIAELKIFKYAGLTSLREPNTAVTVGILGNPDFGIIEKRALIRTYRLDDVADIADINPDYIKIDVQGSELDILRHGVDTLSNALVVQVEVNFIPFYIGQPLFGTIDVFMHRAGFVFHKFREMHCTQSQMYWTDAIYVRDFTQIKTMAIPQRLKLARILWEIYETIDITLLALAGIKISGVDCAETFRNKLEAE